MRLFLDQMIDRCVADVLRETGYDVECAAEAGMARADDLEILQYCTKQDRVLVTLDEHFGDWTVARLTTHAGVIRLKVHPTGSRNIEQTLIPFLARHARRDFRNTLVIVRPSTVRWIHTT
jgi:predicted nuclease of predicted toxin-antitoxin system